MKSSIGLTSSQLKSFTVDIAGLRVLDLDVLLGLKILCYQHRSGEAKGEEKRSSDMFDMEWISQELVRHSQKVRKEVSEKRFVGHITCCLYWNTSTSFMGRRGVEVSRFEFAGGRDFECVWGDGEFLEQMEYYEMEVEVTLKL
jgi:hypothetical protein